MPTAREAARTTIRRVPARDHLVAPPGWTAAESAAFTGIPVTTVTEWRRTGFFVPSLPEDFSNRPQGELFSLGDVVALRVMRILLGAGAEREVVARVGEELPTIDDDGTVWEWPSFRWIAAADPPGGTWFR